MTKEFFEDVCRELDDSRCYEAYSYGIDDDIIGIECYDSKVSSEEEAKEVLMDALEAASGANDWYLESSAEPDEQSGDCTLYYFKCYSGHDDWDDDEDE